MAPARSLYLLPFSGIMFLWFVAVIRDQIGEREDRFFATVFFGSGLLFVASLFVTAAVAGSLVVSVRYLGLGPPTATEVDLFGPPYTLLFAISTRAAAVFLLSLGTIGLRSGAFPRWFALTGYLFGLILMIAVTMLDWVVLVLPACLAVVSVFILRREGPVGTQRKAPPGEPGGEIRFLDRDGESKLVHTSSWGVSTRLLGALVMSHSDDDGLRLPPRVTPRQVVVVPILRGDSADAVTAYAEELATEIATQSYAGTEVRVFADLRDREAPAKRWEWVRKGVPLVLEVGPATSSRTR